MDISNLFGKLTDFKKKMEEAKEQLAEIEVTGEAGGGMVKVTANGNREILSVKFDQGLLDPKDPELLEDVICAAVNQAIKKADEEGQKKLSEMSMDLLPGGLNPGNFGL